MYGDISRDELVKFDKFFDLFIDLKDKLFKLNSNNYYELKIFNEDINFIINGEWSVIEYKKSFDKKGEKFLKFFKNFVKLVE